MTNINLNAAANAIPGFTNPLGTATGAQATATETAKAVGDILSMVTNGNVTVTKTNDKAGANRVVNVPELDEPDEAKAQAADLELLVASLKMEMDEAQVEAAQKRIDSMKGRLTEAHKNQMDKIQKSIDKAREQERAAKAQRAFGWLGAIFAVAMAVVLTVVTGGLAAGFAIAGAAIAVTSLVLSETGADKKIMQAISKSLQDHQGLSKKAADAWAQGIYAGIQMVLSLTCAIGGGCASGGKALVDIAQTTAKAIKLGMSIAGTVVSAGSMGAGLGSAATGYIAASAQADVTENKAVLLKLQKVLEEQEDELQQVLESLNADMSKMADLIESKTSTLSKIASEIGRASA